MPEARCLTGAALAAALRESRARTWSLVDDLSERQWRPPAAPGVNPIAWELAHLAWFAEFWVLRGPHSRSAEGHALGSRPPLHAGPDVWLDSSRLAHAERWDTPMPDRATLGTMLAGQLDACLDALPGDADAAALYFHRLALLHEDMHGEAFCWLRSALGYAAPPGIAVPAVPQSTPLAVPGATLALGRRPGGAGFAFDNELPGREAEVAAFEIDSAPVSAQRFSAFVDAGGYTDPRWWPGDAGAWRASSRLAHPGHWRRDAEGGGWQVRWFDQWLPLAADAPVLHVNAFEAEAFCRWAGRRLPRAAEWEHAARYAGSGCGSAAASASGGASASASASASGSSFNSAFHWGASVWEWTADPFVPYPGFAPGPYREYSEPWFGDHRELRGGAFATHPRLHDARYRNFFLPQRNDVFAGFRTAAA